MKTSRRRLRHFVVFCAVAFFVGYFFSHYHFALTVEDEYAGYEALARGTARTPMQYRVLVPGLVQRLSSLPLLSTMSRMRLYKWFDHLSVFLLIVAFRQYLRRWFSSGVLASLLSFAMPLVLPIAYIIAHRVRYPYDMPAIAFFAAGLICIKEKWWWRYYLLFPLATLNRETSCFLTITYALVSLGKTKNRVVVLHCAAQLTIWLSIKCMLSAVYSDNIGPGLFENKLISNIHYLLTPRQWPFFFSILSYLWIPVLLFHRRIADEYVYRTLWMTVPFVVGMMIVGVISEMRIYGELYPIWLLAALLILKSFFLEECTAGPRPSASAPLSVS